MKRTNKHKNPDAILTSDWHLREDKPPCRTDDFNVAQWKKVSYVDYLQKLYDCPVLHGGDLFNIWKPSPELLTQASLNLPKKFLTIYGNHCMPQHNIDLVRKCGVYNLWANHKLGVLTGVHYRGPLPKKPSLIIKGRKILIWHIMCYTGYIPFATKTDWKAEEIFKKYPQYDLILTGHNHKSFVHKEDGRVLVNPGALTRQTSADINNEPVVYLWYADTNTVESVYLPAPGDVVSREHIRVKEEKSERLQAFISKLDGDWHASVNFEDNLKAFESANRVLPSVMDIVHESINLKL